MDAQKFGIFVAAVRKGHQMTQAELASKIRVSDKAVSRWERGLGFPDINTFEPLAEALDVSVLELMKSERIETQEIQCEEAVTVLSNTIKEVDNQRQAERKQERKVIASAVGMIALCSIFVLLMDSYGWSVQDVVFTSIGITLPLISLIAVVVFVVIGIIRCIRGKSSKLVWITVLTFATMLFVLLLVFFALGLFAFPGQQ